MKNIVTRSPATTRLAMKEMKNIEKNKNMR